MRRGRARGRVADQGVEVSATARQGWPAPVPRRLDGAGRRLRLALLAAAVALPLALAGVSAWSAWRDAWREALSETTRSAEAAAEYAQRVLDGHRMLVDRINDLLRGLTDAEIRAREAALHAALATMLADHPSVQTAYVGDREGRLLLSARVFPVPRDHGFADREFHALLRGPDAPPSVVTRVYAGRVERNRFFAVARRRAGTGNRPPPEDGFDGQANVSVNPERMAEGLRRLRAHPEDVVSLVRADGAVLARTAGLGPPDQPMQVSPASPMAEAMARGETRFTGRGRSSLDGVERIGAYRRLEGWPVYVAVARPAAAVVARWRRTVLPQAALGLASALLLAALALLVLRRQGDLAEANAGLEQRVAERAAELDRARAAMREHDARLRLAVEAAQFGSFEIDLATRRVSRTGRVVPARPGLPLAGVPLDRYLEEIAHPGDLPHVRATFDAVAAGSPEHYRLEYRVRRPDGSWCWMESYGAIVARDPADGAPLRIAGVSRDVSDRKAAEERLVLLAREVDHRAKNALAVVQAAVRLAPKHDAAAFARAVEGRVAALARAQVMLAESSWQGAPLRAVAEGALAAFLPGREDDGGGPRAEIAGAEVQLGAAAAQPLSLALHELATNAAKHGALSVPGGRVGLAWHVDARSDRLRLSWSEAGGPALAAPPSRRGFGSRVIEATVEDQLGGTLRRRWAAEGLSCEIEVPLSRALAPAAP